MRTTVIATRAAVAAAALALAAVPAMAGAAGATWGVAHPPYTAVDNVPYAPLNAISAVSATSVWAVGQSSGTPLVDHFNGSSWAQSTLPSGPCDTFEADCNLTGVSADSASDAIAVGNGTFAGSAGWVTGALAFRWNGSAWQALPVPGSIQSGALQLVQAFSPTDAWAVGIGPATTGSGIAAANWNGASWTPVATNVSFPSGGLTITAISGSSASDVWVVGKTSTGGYHNRKITSVIVHYNGSSWKQMAAPDNSGLLDVDADSPADAWAIAADGGVLHWNGATWTVATQLGLDNVAAIAALSPTDVWVADQVTLSHFNGTSWTSTALPAGVNGLVGHAVAAGGHIWFGGFYYPSNAVTAPAVLSTSAG